MKKLLPEALKSASSILVMKKIMLFQPKCFSVLAIMSLSISGLMLSGCSNLAKHMPLADPPTAVDQNFGFAVQKMIEIQQRPMVGYGMVSGYQLEGAQAEKIINEYDRRE